MEFIFLKGYLKGKSNNFVKLERGETHMETMSQTNKSRSQILINDFNK